MKKLTLIFITTTLIIACSKTKKETNQVTNAINQAIETAKELPETKQKINNFKAKLNTQKLSGTFSGTMNSQVLQINTWNSSLSRITFIKNKAIFNLYAKHNKEETLTIKITTDNLYENSKEKEFAPSMFPIDLMDKKLVEKASKGYIQISYKNKTTGDEFHSGKGDIQLEALSENTLKIQYKGEAMQGDWKEKNFIPTTWNINLNYNFLTNDLRSK